MKIVMCHGWGVYQYLNASCEGVSIMKDLKKNGITFKDRDSEDFTDSYRKNKDFIKYIKEHEKELNRLYIVEIPDEATDYMITCNDIGDDDMLYYVLDGKICVY